MISGIKANKNTAIISINKNGKTPFTISLNFKPVIEQAVNRLYPNGGVTYPITRLITKILIVFQKEQELELKLLLLPLCPSKHQLQKVLTSIQLNKLFLYE